MDTSTMILFSSVKKCIPALSDILKYNTVQHILDMKPVKTMRKDSIEYFNVLPSVLTSEIYVKEGVITKNMLHKFVTKVIMLEITYK